GWSHGDEEIISTEQAIAWFNLENIGRSPARFDFKKLDNLNAHYIRNADDRVLVDEIGALLRRKQPPQGLDDKARSRLLAAMPGFKDRAKTLVELAEAAEFLYTDGPRLLDAPAEKVLSPQGREILARLAPVLETGEWTAATIEQRVRQFAEESGFKLGQAAQPIRAAVTGKT